MFSLTSLGAGYLPKKGEYDDAIRKYETAAELNPKYARVYYDWGEALDGKGECNDAIEKYKKAAELNPNLAPPPEVKCSRFEF